MTIRRRHHRRTGEDGKLKLHLVLGLQRKSEKTILVTSRQPPKPHCQLGFVYCLFLLYALLEEVNVCLATRFGHGQPTDPLRKIKRQVTLLFNPPGKASGDEAGIGRSTEVPPVVAFYGEPMSLRAGSLGPRSTPCFLLPRFRSEAEWGLETVFGPPIET